MSNKLFLTPPELIPYVLDIIPKIYEYKIIEIDSKKKLSEMPALAGVFKTVAEAKKAGYKGYPVAGLSHYDIGDTSVTILV